MASDRLKKLIEEVESVSASYAESSSQLSDLIVAFENRLNSLKGKVQVQVTGASVTLGFVRGPKRWELVVSDTSARGKRGPLTAAPVSVKAHAVPLFEKLLEKMVEAHKAAKTPADLARLQLRSMLAQFESATPEKPSSPMEEGTAPFREIAELIALHQLASIGPPKNGEHPLATLLEKWAPDEEEAK